MFLLVSVRRVGAHPDELQHGVSIQSSFNLGKTFPRICPIRIIPSTQILGRVFVYLPPTFHFPDSGLYLSNGFDFYFVLFWMARHWKPAISPKHHVPFGKTTTTKSFIMIMVTKIIMITELGKRRSVEDEEKKEEETKRSNENSSFNYHSPFDK